MRTVLQKAGLILLFIGIVVWLVGGARKGFYVVTEEIAQYDLITEIHYVDNHQKFLPGIETLGISLILGGSFWLSSFLFSQPSIQNSKYRR